MKCLYLKIICISLLVNPAMQAMGPLKNLATRIAQAVLKFNRNDRDYTAKALKVAVAGAGALSTAAIGKDAYDTYQQVLTLKQRDIHDAMTLNQEELKLKKLQEELGKPTIGQVTPREQEYLHKQLQGITPFNKPLFFKEPCNPSHQLRHLKMVILSHSRMMIFQR